MDTILYYSNYCQNCTKALRIIGKSSVKNSMHFICIDNRHTKDGQTFAVLETGKEVRLPPNLTSVPALLLLNRGYRLLSGDEIMDYVSPKVEADKQGATGTAGEPLAFSFTGGGFIASDTYSFLDQSVEDLEAKGDGGMKQLHHYARPGQADTIETPPDAESSNKQKEGTQQTYSASV